MFEKHFGLSENPFLSGPQAKFLYPSLGHQEAVAHLRHAIRNREPFVMLITGEIGVGKTTAVHDALGESGSRAKIVLITNPALAREELVHEVCVRLGLGRGPDGAAYTISQLERHLLDLRAKGETAFLLLDEAEHLDPGMLAEIALLTDLQADGESLIQIILVGQPQLEVRLAQPDLRPLAEHIGPRYHVEPLGAAETTQYIHHRVTVAGGDAQKLFPAETCAKLFRVSRGIPIEINTAAGRALHQAFSAGAAVVAPDHVPEPAPATAPAVREDNAFLTPSARSLSTEGGIDMARALSPELFASANPLFAGAETAKPAAADDSERILPSWFDDIIAKRKATEETVPETPTPVAERLPEPVAEQMPEPVAEEIPEPVTLRMREPAPPPPTVAVPVTPVAEPALAAATQSPVAAAATHPMAVSMPPSAVAVPAPPVAEPAVATAAVAPAPAEVVSAAPQTLAPPAEATVSNGKNGHAESEEAGVSVEEEFADLIPDDISPVLEEGLEELQPAATEDVALIPSPPPAPIDFVERRSDYPSDEEINQRPRPAANPGWPVATALVACVLICVVLILRLIPATLRQALQGPTPTSAPTVVQVPATDHSEAPTPETTAPPRKPAAKPAPKSATKADGKADRSATAGQPATKGDTKKSPTTPPTTVKPTSAATKSTSKVQPAVAAPAKPQPAPQTYGISVGSFLYEDRAVDKMTKLSDSTGLPSSVVPYADEDGATAYRVVIGSFGSRSAAEKKADELVERGVVQEARVIPLSKAEAKP